VQRLCTLSHPTCHIQPKSLIRFLKRFIRLQRAAASPEVVGSGEEPRYSSVSLWNSQRPKKEIQSRINISMYKTNLGGCLLCNRQTQRLCREGALEISVRVPLERSRQSQRAADSRLLKNQVSSSRVMVFATIPSQIAAAMMIIREETQGFPCLLTDRWSITLLEGSGAANDMCPVRHIQQAVM
jgi:hypothetical protein